jgi:hypothetical protein
MQTLFPLTHTGYFDGLEILIERDEFITTDKFLNLSMSNSQLLYLKRDFLFRSGEFRGERYKSLLSRISEAQGKCVIVGHSDIPTLKKHIVLLKRLGIKSVFGTNSVTWKDFSRSLPLGLTNFTTESELHPIFGNIEHFKFANSSDYCLDFRPKILANFSVQNNYSERKGLLNTLSLLSYSYDLVLESPEINPNGRISYLRKLREVPMVVCPEGNGVDTHRLWETLYMGGVPIVVNNPLLNSLFDCLPVIRLDSWSHLKDVDYIESQWNSIRSTEWNPNILSVSYWTKEITVGSA